MIILIFALRCWWSTEEKQPAMTSCHSSSSKPAVVREFPVRCPDTTWKHSQDRVARRRRFILTGNGRAVASSGTRPRRFLYLPLLVFGFQTSVPLRAACFPPSHRLRFVFMLGNQKQPVSLAAASWLIKHEAAMTTTKSSPPPPPPQDRRPAVLPCFFSRMTQCKHDLTLKLLAIASTLYCVATP